MYTVTCTYTYWLDCVVVLGRGGGHGMIVCTCAVLVTVHLCEHTHTVHVLHVHGQSITTFLCKFIMVAQFPLSYLPSGFLPVSAFK